MFAGLTTDWPMPVRSVGGFGTVGAVLARATVRLLDCTDAPKPSVTVSRKKNVALGDREVRRGERRDAGRPGTVSIVTFATAHVGAHGAPALSVCTHW